MQSNPESMPDAMKIRRWTIEFTFGTLKHWTGVSDLLMEAKSHVRTQLSLHILAHIMKLVMKIMSSVTLIKAMKKYGKQLFKQFWLVLTDKITTLWFRCFDTVWAKAVIYLNSQHYSLWGEKQNLSGNFMSFIVKPSRFCSDWEPIVEYCSKCSQLH